MTTTSKLVNTDQLLAKRPFQLGSKKDGYCTVQFGLSDIDEHSYNRTIKIVLNEQDLAILKAFDTENEDKHNIVKVSSGEHVVNIKVNKKTKVEGGGSLEDLLLCGVDCAIIVKPMKWNMSDQNGIYLKCLAIQIIEDDFSFL